MKGIDKQTSLLHAEENIYCTGHWRGLEGHKMKNKIVERCVRWVQV